MNGRKMGLTTDLHGNYYDIERNKSKKRITSNEVIFYFLKLEQLELEQRVRLTGKQG